MVSREDRVLQVLAVAMCLGMLGMVVMPLAVGASNLGLYLASRGEGAGAAGVTLAGAGLMRVGPEIGMGLVELGLVTSSTGVGIAVGSIMVGVGLAL